MCAFFKMAPINYYQNAMYCITLLDTLFLYEKLFPYKEKE